MENAFNNTSYLHSIISQNRQKNLTKENSYLNSLSCKEILIPVFDEADSSKHTLILACWMEFQLQERAVKEVNELHRGTYSRLIRTVIC